MTVYLQSLVLMLFVFLFPVGGNAQVWHPPLMLANYVSLEAPTLRLSVKIIRRSYCRGDFELDGVNFDGTFTFTNTGAQTLILYKGSGRIARVMAGRNVEDLALGRFELNSSLESMSTPFNRDDFKGSAPNSYFVKLPPGGSYVVSKGFGVFAVRGDKRKIGGALLSGEYAVQVEVTTWPDRTDFAEELGKRWKSSGGLFYQLVTSSPVAVTIEKERRVKRCY